MQSLMLAVILGLVVGGELGEAGPSQVDVTTQTITIPTYPYENHLQTRHSAEFNMDYLWLNWSSYVPANPLPQDYELLVVENPYLRLTFLPELGGRLYGATLKATGEELFYQNPVIKPTHWGPLEQGWWLAAGGLEWCLPVDEHGYEWGVPWAYSVTLEGEGATVTLWDTQATDRVRARVRVHLPGERAAFEVSPRLENPTGAPVTFKFWDNAMLAPGVPNTVGADLHFVVPIDRATVHSTGDGRLPGPGQAMDWPVHNGVDYARLGNWDQWLGFFARPQAAEDWAGVFDEGLGHGVARVFPHQVAVGVKGFGFGWEHPIGSENWTDDGSFYVELHGGPSPTFWDSITLGPGETLEWTETWLPLRGLPSLSLATSEFALGLRPVGSDLEVGVWAAGAHEDAGVGLWRQQNCEPLWRQEGFDLVPGEGRSWHLAGLGPEAGEVVFGVFEGSAWLVRSGFLDCEAPSARVDPLPTVRTSEAFAVSWSLDDPDGMARGVDVQVRNGAVNAPWTNWLTCTLGTSALFAGQAGHTYTFRARACDLDGRIQVWPTDPWADTFTTVLLEPAPVLITSAKTAQPMNVDAGDVVEFEISLRNTGNLAATVQITDSLPTALELAAAPWSTQSPDPVVDGPEIQWSGTLEPGGAGVTIGFQARVVEIQPGGVTSNTVWINDGVHPAFRRQVEVAGWQRIYLPLVLRD